MADKILFPGITATHTAYYSKKHNMRTKPMALIFSKAMPIIREILNIPSDLKIELTALKKKSLRGRYIPSKKLVLVDCRLELHRAILTLIHELTHAEQYHTGKLTQKFEWVGRRYKTFCTWDDKVYALKTTSYNKYFNFPWEVEARANEEPVSKLVYARMAELGFATIEYIGKEL